MKTSSKKAWVQNQDWRQHVAATVVEAFVQERTRRGLSKTRLAEMAGLSLAMVSYVERVCGIRPLNPASHLGSASKSISGG